MKHFHLKSNWSKREILAQLHPSSAGDLAVDEQAALPLMPGFKRTTSKHVRCAIFPPLYS